MIACVIIGRCMHEGGQARYTCRHAGKHVYSYVTCYDLNCGYSRSPPLWSPTTGQQYGQWSPPTPVVSGRPRPPWSPPCCRQLQEHGHPVLDRPVITIRGAEAYKLRRIISEQQVARARIKSLPGHQVDTETAVSHHQ